jgi:hypothetical protein
MARRSKRLLTDTERAELWARWRRGDTLSDISRVLAMVFCPLQVKTLFGLRNPPAPGLRQPFPSDRRAWLHAPRPVFAS